VLKRSESQRMEAPMKRCHFVALDTHVPFCELAAVDERGNLKERSRCGTRIPDLVELLERVPRPRRLVIEEGPLADWLWRNLRAHVDEMIVCEPRRNRLVSEDGDKDDPLDAEKLAQLYRGGYVKVVHHSDSLARSIFKQHVTLYHQRVRQRVGEGHRVRCLFARHGVFLRAKDFADPEQRPALLARLPESTILREGVELLFQSYDLMTAQESRWRRRLVQMARDEDVVRRFVELPGIGPVRAATLYVILDTPWRFASKAKLWKYLGIGLERRRSGKGPERLRVPVQVNRVLKGTILGAAKSAVAQGDNPFAEQHRRWMDTGLSAKLARRNVARSLAATLWGLWKNGSAYRPEWVGVAAAAMRAAPASRQAAVANHVGRSREAAEFRSESMGPARSGVPCHE
jgi:transposase